MKKELAIVIAAVAEYLDLADEDLITQGVKGSRSYLKSLLKDKQLWKWSLRSLPQKNSRLSPWRQSKIYY